MHTRYIPVFTFTKQQQRPFMPVQSAIAACTMSPPQVPKRHKISTAPTHPSRRFAINTPFQVWYGMLAVDTLTVVLAVDTAPLLSPT